MGIIAIVREGVSRVTKTDKRKKLIFDVVSVHFAWLNEVLEEKWYTDTNWTCWKGGRLPVWYPFLRLY